MTQIFSPSSYHGDLPGLKRQRRRLWVSTDVHTATHHSHSVSDGFGRQVAAELGADHPAAAVSPGHFAPDYSGLVGFTTRSHCVPAERQVGQHHNQHTDGFHVHCWVSQPGGDHSLTPISAVYMFNMKHNKSV